jgi:cell wall-associated NlpC family hydrolase
MFPRLLLVFLLTGAGFAADPVYRSPYRVHFTFSDQELIGDLLKGPRADWKDQSTLPFREWYVPGTRRLGYWGPPARHYPAPAGLAARKAEWMRERVIATGLRFAGYGYQHHHVPDWEPPADWPADGNAAAPVGKGLDCSNFTAFVYNLALGIKPTGDVQDQAELTAVAGPGPNRTTPVQRIALPQSYADFGRELRVGDLLFIKNRQGAVSHVVLWVGNVGKSRDGTPLILDSTGEGSTDSEGNKIPAGVNLRPFKQGYWYAASASHALRIVADGK